MMKEKRKKGEKENKGGGEQLGDKTISPNFQDTWMKNITLKKWEGGIYNWFGKA